MLVIFYVCEKSGFNMIKEGAIGLAFTLVERIIVWSYARTSNITNAIKQSSTQHLEINFVLCEFGTVA